MRQDIQIETRDNYTIHGTLDSGNNKSLIIFVHGFTGNKDEHQFFNAVPYFMSHGFDVYRFNFYCSKAKSRRLMESSILTHSKDLQTVIEHFKQSYDKLVLVGHSLGPLVILSTDLAYVHKLVLWDPSTPFNDIKEKNAEFDPKLGKYVFHWGIDYIISNEMVEEWMKFDLSLHVHELKVPVKFIFAGNYNKHTLWKPYLEKVQVEHESVIVEGATHCFIEEGTEQKLFDETLKWVSG